MTGTLVAAPPAPRARPRGLRRALRAGVPIGFVAAALFGVVALLPLGGANARFDHTYAHLPGGAGLVPFGNAIEPLPPANLITGVDVSSLGLLVQALPPGVVSRSGQTWTIHQPVLVADGASIELRGPATLVLAPGAYLEVGPGGTGRLSDLTVEGAASTAARGFLLDVDGRLTVDHATLRHLGRLATLTEGLSFEAARAGSGVTDSKIVGNTVGVYVTASTGVSVTGTKIVGSQLDGIELHGDVTRASLVADRIHGSGLNDVELSGNVTATSIASCTLGAAVADGIELYDAADATTITGDRISGTFDGIVVDYSSGNLMEGDAVTGVQRFGVRVVGTSTGNVFRALAVSSSPVGVYLADGATRNRVLQTRFSSDGENVRDRRSAPGNRFVPVPANSELRSA